MTTKSCMVISQREWDRLKNQTKPPEDKPPVDPYDEERKAQIERSQNWIRSWPDSDQGIILQASEYYKTKRDKEYADLKTFAEKLKGELADRSGEAVQKAKNIIFDQGGYGRELLSALYESKTLEERDAQIKFKNKIKEKALKYEKANEWKYPNVILERDTKHEEIKRKQKNIEFATINIEVAKLQKEKLAKLKECRIKGDIEDARLMKIYLDHEKELEKTHNGMKEIWQREALENEKRAKLMREQKAITEQLEDNIIKMYHKHNDIVCRRKKHLFQQMYKERYNKETSEQNYNMVKTLQDAANNRYNNFIENSVKQYEIISQHNDQIEKLKRKSKLSQLKELAEHYKELANSKNKSFECGLEHDRNQCVCWRQSLFTGTRGESRKKPAATDTDTKTTKKPPCFLVKPKTTLVQQLKLRELDPSPYTATTEGHARFAQKASEIYDQCHYKGPIKKVIHEYIKSNNLTKQQISSWVNK